MEWVEGYISPYVLLSQTEGLIKSKNNPVCKQDGT